MIRMIIQLRPDQQTRLRAIARKENRSMAELVRRGVDSIIEQEDPSGERKRRALAISGMFSGGTTDMSINHDKYAWDEELESIRAYDQAKEFGDEAIPFDQAVKEIEGWEAPCPPSED